MSTKVTSVLVCTNIDCKNRGAEAVLRGLEERLHNPEHAAVQVEPYMCFSACNNGPNVVIASKRCWFSDVQQSDLDEVVAYIDGGADIPRLREQNDPDLEEMIFEIIDAGLTNGSE